jgi:hypothetical protein
MKGMTTKQVLTAKKLMENNGVVSKAMIAAGYSKETAKNPQQITRSKGWKQLTKQFLSPDILTKKHAQMLEAKKQIGAQILINADGKVISKENEGMIEVDDNQTQLKAVELGYRVTGLLHSDTAVVPVQINNNINSLSDSIKEIVKAIYDQHPTTGTNTV